MPELLTGTVTFFFSDIEGSTRILNAQGDAWPPLLARHQELVRAAIRTNGGEEMGTEGDSFFVAFPTAPGAVAAAVAAQRSLASEPWPEGAEIRVRIGLHTGEASFSAKTYVGLHVHRASRIAAAGHGGQVLISAATRALLDQALPDGVELRDLGEHRLKDLERPERLWQLVIAELPSDFPPLGSLDAVPNNLPTRLTSFLGREREIEAVRELLGAHRLLTLTGPGGTGKTRLSLEVAERVMPEFPNGVTFVELAAISDPDLVAPTIAKDLGLPDRGGRSVIERLIDHIGEARRLLVLDNFEQVTGAAPVVGQLLAACPNLTVLTSSRSALHVSGEQEYAVPPLDLPDPANLPSLTNLSQYEAVALFIDRARAVKPDFAVTNDNAPAVAEICVRLDGLPLAIELAAARIRVLTPQAMLPRLTNRLALLSGGQRDLPERQQTLRGAIAWSHEMLEDSDRNLFACLAVFNGGARLEAVERVCSDAVSGDLLDVLASLVEKSLVRQHETPDGEPRFAMLETIQEFATEQAIERGRWDDLRRRHAELFVEVARASAAEVMGSTRRAWLDRLEEDHDNLRAAFAWAVEASQPEVALQLCASLWRFWQMRGHLVEGLERTEVALALPDAAKHEAARADALSAAAGLAYWLADSERSRAFYEDEIEARRALEDRAGLAEALYGISFTWSIVELQTEQDAARSTAAISEALEIFRGLDDRHGIGRCEWALSNVAWSARQTAGARQHAERAIEVFEEIGDAFMLGWATYTLGLAALTDHQQADAPRPDLLTEATERFTRALRIFSESQDVTGYTLVIDGLAIVALRSGDRQRAARLSGAVSTLERTTSTGLNIWNRGVLQFDQASLRADPELAEAWASGERMSADEAVAYALAGT